MRSNLLKATLAAAALSASLAAGPAFAIGEGLPVVTTQAAVTAACSAPGATAKACQDAVAAFLGYLETAGLTDEQLQAAVVALVKELATTPGTNKDVIAAGLGVVVAEAEATGSPLARVLDTTQVAALTQIQQSVINGTVQTAALPGVFSRT
jgi:hypothetical protein